MNKSKFHKKITISVPIELDNIIEQLVEASKTTEKPISKSQLFVVAVHEYLRVMTKVSAQRKGEK